MPRCGPSTPPRSPPDTRTTAGPASAPCTTPATTARSSSTPTGTTSRSSTTIADPWTTTPHATSPASEDEDTQSRPVPAPRPWHGDRRPGLLVHPSQSQVGRHDPRYADHRPVLGQAQGGDVIA